MLNELQRITSIEPYKSQGAMWIKEISILPWQNPDVTLVFELLENEIRNEERQVWEVTCYGLAGTGGIPQALIPTTQVKLYDDHPLLWNFGNEIFFSIKSKTSDIPSLMGDLFMEHSRACGNWIDFHWLYAVFPETLITGKENQLAIPEPLQKACFKVLEKYNVEYLITEVEKKEKDYSVLFFSNTANWPDDKNFEQSHIIAKEFSERRVR